jgi:CheY-like chemotaxis protein
MQIMQAMDGQEALDFMASASAPPDVILLDVMMPGMSGWVAGLVGGGTAHQLQTTDCQVLVV